MGYGTEAQTKVGYIISAITEGMTLEQACRTHGLSVTTFHEVISSVRELAVRYARAREIRADLDVDQAVAIADDPDIDPQRARNMIEIRKWRASKHNARVYGERIDLNVTQQVSIGEALAEARARILRSVSDQPPVIDAETVDLPTLPAPGPTDNESVKADLGPSIFD